jgi:hypothetical protein
VKVRDTIARDLTVEPQGVVRVDEDEKLAADLREYVLEDPLPREFAKVLEPVIQSARPAAEGTDKVGVWISGFFGTGKSHFAKIAGHLLADTPVDSDTARGMFVRLLHAGRHDDERLRELLQEAATYRLKAHLVAFDIQAQQVSGAEADDAGLTFLRAFHSSLGLSRVLAFAERELDLQAKGKYDQFLSLYQERAGVPWEEDKDLTTSSGLFAECLAELLPERYRSAELAHESLKLALDQLHGPNIAGVVDRMLGWLASQEHKVGAPLRLVFVADEVGAWAGRDLQRIEQLRALEENVASKGKGRIWLIVTSQEKLSAIVQNVGNTDEATARQHQQRLEARFPINVHLESSGVGTVIEERILSKKPGARPELERLFARHQGQLADVAEPPGLGIDSDYPRAEQDRFVADYPFLPYQLPAAADLFSNMRGVKVNPGARSMIRIAFDALRELADQEIGVVVSWDRIFDSANRENEFADEGYLGSQGLEYMRGADRDLPDALVRPSRLLKVLWLVERSPRISRTAGNVARLLVDSLDADVLDFERRVQTTLEALAARHYVRREVGTEEWRFLTQEEVTVERIVEEIPVREKEVRDELSRLFQERLQHLFPGRITMGQNNTAFEYGVFWTDTALKHEGAPVRLVACPEGSGTAKLAAQANASNLEEPVVWWVLPRPEALTEKVRRALAIGRLRQDEEFRRVATSRLEEKARRLEEEAAQLRRDAEGLVEEAFERGRLLWGGQEEELGTTSGGEGPRSRLEQALRDRLAIKYHRFTDADRRFEARNIERLFSVPPAERPGLDPSLGLFTPEGHVRGGDPLVEEVAKHLASTTKTAGRDVAERFSRPPFGWPADLVRYVAAAMFVDGRLSVVDKAGRRYDDPRAKEVQALFGTQAFKDAKLEIEEEALTPEEADAARRLLTELGHKPQDPGEVALRDACVQARDYLRPRLAMVERARDAGVPLPEAYDRVTATLAALDVSGPRVKTIRAFIEHANALRQAKEALDRLERFERHHGLAQFGRAIRLREAALQAGLPDDETVGPKVQAAVDGMDAVIEQRRVLDEWEKAFQRCLSDLVDAFRSVYVPLREEAHRRVEDARRRIEAMPEYGQLSVSDRAKIRAEFLAEGRPLGEIPLLELKTEEQLVAASASHSVSHLRAILAALDAQVQAARAWVLQLAAAAQDEPRMVLWDPAKALGNRRFATEAEVDEAFDAQKEHLKALIREGKVIEVP